MALVLWIKAAQLLDGLASNLAASFLIELQLLGANMHSAQCLRERVAHEFGAGHVEIPGTKSYLRYILFQCRKLLVQKLENWKKSKRYYGAVGDCVC